MISAIGKVRAVVGLVLALAVVLGGAYGLGVIGAPSVDDVQNRFGGVNQTTTVVVTNLTVSNPNPIGISLGGVSVNYTVDLNEVRLASGTKHGVAVDSGNSSLTFRTAMANEQIPKWWVNHIRDGESSQLVVTADVTSATLGRTFTVSPVNREISTDILSAFNSTERRPVNANRPLVSDPVLYIEESSATWGSVTEARTPIEMSFDVYNPKSAPYVVTGIGYEITMNGVAMGSGETDRAYSIPPKATRTIRASTAIENENLDEWWVSHLENDQVTDLRIDFYVRIELPGGQEIQVPMDAMTYEETIETDFFGTEAGSGADGGGNATTTEGGDTSTAESGDTPTADGTATETATPTEAESPLETTTETETEGPTATETSTDDGLL